MTHLGRSQPCRRLQLKITDGRINANGAWLACAVMAYNLTRAVGVLAGGKLDRARTATIRYQIINIPARISYSAREFTMHLPTNSRRERSFTSMLNALNAPPKAA